MPAADMAGFAAVGMAKPGVAMVGYHAGMALSAYDSPTFLGRKDRFLLGMSLSQLGICALVAVFWWFFLGWTTGLDVMPRAAVFGVCQGGTVAALFVRLAGLSVPSYCWLMLKQLVRKPLWESNRERLVNGEPDPAAEARGDRATGRRSLLGRLKPGGQRAELELDERRYELQAEGEQAMEESMRAGQDFVKEGMRAPWRG